MRIIFGVRHIRAVLMPRERRQFFVGEFWTHPKVAVELNITSDKGFQDIQDLPMGYQVKKCFAKNKRMPTKNLVFLCRMPLR